MAEIANWQDRIVIAIARVSIRWQRVEAPALRPERICDAEAETPLSLVDPRCRLCWWCWLGEGGLRVLQPGLVGTRQYVQAAATAGIRPEISAGCPAGAESIAPAPVQPTTAAVPPAVNDAAARADRVRRYVEQYNGGDCFFILPVAISSNAAVIEGFGASTAPFEALDRAFKRDLGFEASIGVRQVTQAQCPAIKFLGQLGGNQARAPRINLDSVDVKNGETLSGTIENFANRVVELLLVSDSGEVRNLSYLLKPGTDSLSFSIGMQRNGGGDGPQLVMAVDDPAGSRFPAAAQADGRRYVLPAGGQRGSAQQCHDLHGGALFPPDG